MPFRARRRRRYGFRRRTGRRGNNTALYSAVRRLQLQVRRFKPETHVVSYSDTEVNNGNGICLNCNGFNGSANQAYLYPLPKRSEVVNVDGTPESSGLSAQKLDYYVGHVAMHSDDTFFTGFHNGMKICMSSPFLHSNTRFVLGYMDDSNGESSAITNPDSSEIISFGLDNEIDRSRALTVDNAGVLSSAEPEKLAGCVGMSHYLLSFRIMGTFYTRYLKASHGAPNSNKMDDMVEKDMSTWTEGVSYRIVIVQQYKQSYTEDDLKEADIFEGNMYDEQFYRPGRFNVRSKGNDPKHWTKVGFQSDNTLTARSKKFHILKTFRFRHGNIATDVRDLNNWTTPVDINFRVPLKYQLVKYITVVANPRQKRIMNPIFVFIQTDYFQGGSSHTALNGRPSCWFRGSIRSYHQDQMPQPAFH